VEVIHTDICSKCHPLFTGEQRIVDTEGQVDRFYRKLEARSAYLAEKEARDTARTSPDQPLATLELSDRIVNTLSRAGINTIAQALSKLEESDDAILAVDGFGRKSLIDLKKRLRQRGFPLPGEEAPATPE
jgi:large subunit ribosomal protein L31